MKTITTQEHDSITDAIGEGLTTLAEAIIEKDLLLTEVLQAIQTIDREEFGLVFCGGTCLSKAHGLIDRMSEDIDFKLVLPEGLSRNARSPRLSQYKKRLARDFELMGFDVPADKIVARDENSYVSLNLHYKSLFPAVASLRTEIKVELNARSPVLPTEMLTIRSMLSILTKQTATEVPIECISVEETLAEKVLSFLRRTAEARAGCNRGGYDNRLVRHLYDVRAIARVTKSLELSQAHFATMVAGDGAQYRNQNPAFEQDPAGQIRGVLVALQSESTTFERDYLLFVDELVFGESVPFAEASAVFSELASQLISALPDSQPPTKAFT